jgi:hypothetical protein
VDSQVDAVHGLVLVIRSVRLCEAFAELRVENRLGGDPMPPG